MTRRTIIGFVFIVAALLKLADMWGILYLNLERPWTEYFGPLLLLYVGIELVIYGFNHNPSQWLKRPVPVGEQGKRICCTARLGADAYTYRGEHFHGARLDAFFGGIRLDLREAVICEDEEIDVRTFVGGVELYVPDNVNVIVKSHSFIGGVGNETTNSPDKNARKIYITASNYFGGVSVKQQIGFRH